MKKMMAAAAALAMGMVGTVSAHASTIYNANSFVRGSESHSMWLAGFDGQNRRFHFSPVGTLIVELDGTASLEGRVIETGSAGDGFDISVSFGVLNTAPNPKLSHGLGSNPSVDPNTFEYFSLTGGTLTGLGAYAGIDFDISERTGGKNHFSQLGFGANDKTATDGFSSWFFYEVASTCTANQCSSFGTGKGDFNMDIILRGPDIDNPVPIPAAGVLMAGVLAAGGLKRRKATK